MMISDHLETTFYECLQANIPVVILLNQRTYVVDKMVKPL